MVHHYPAFGGSSAIAFVLGLCCSAIHRFGVRFFHYAKGAGDFVLRAVDGSLYTSFETDYKIYTLMAMSLC